MFAAGCGSDEAGSTDLYEITDGPRPFAVAGVVFGMIGDRSVVATDAQRARSVAGMEVSDVEDVEGAAVARADLGSWTGEQVSDLGIDTLDRVV